MKYFDKVALRMKEVNSCLCIGIDPDPVKCGQIMNFSIPKLIDFLKTFVDKTAPYAAVYKPNLAFFEVLGPHGMEVFETLCKYIPKEIPVLADAKRGDIGNTAGFYAKTFFEYYDVDAITVNPYLGADTLESFYKYPEKGVYVLALTSNPGSADFQKPSLFMDVAKKMVQVNELGNIALVVGATHQEGKEIRDQVNLPFLIPGVGAQKGDLVFLKDEILSKNDLDLVNVSRGIMFPGELDNWNWNAVCEAAEKYNLLLKREV